MRTMRRVGKKRKRLGMWKVRRSEEEEEKRIKECEIGGGREEYRIQKDERVGRD